MSKLIFSLFALAMICPVMAETPAEKAQAYYQSGIAAEKDGNPESARKAYQAALATDPGHANARYRLGELKLHAGTIASKGREAKFGAVTIPAFQLEDASVQEAIDALSTLMVKQSKGQVEPNFVIQDPKAALAERRLSFQLKNVPAKAVLDYILAQAGAKARFDEHAVVIVPR